jgi:hypothetical protein
MRFFAGSGSITIDFLWNGGANTNAMLEKLAPEVWKKELTAGPNQPGPTPSPAEDEREAVPPRAADVLREIAVMLVVHALLATFVLSVVKAFGLR